MWDYRDFKGGMRDAGCGMKMQGRPREKPHFEGVIQDRTATCEMISESQNIKIHKATRF